MSGGPCNRSGRTTSRPTSDRTARSTSRAVVRDAGRGRSLDGHLPQGQRAQDRRSVGRLVGHVLQRMHEWLRVPGCRAHDLGGDGPGRPGDHPGDSRPLPRREAQPWNEVECGDHYARSMASYAVFLAACGYEYHGPKGYLAFARGFNPTISARLSRRQKAGARSPSTGPIKSQTASIALRWGRLKLKRLRWRLKEGFRPTQVAAQLAGKPVSDVNLAGEPPGVDCRNRVSG